MIRILFNALDEALIIVDANGRFIDVNPSACKLFKQSHQELIGRSLSDFWRPQVSHLAFPIRYPIQESKRGQIKLTLTASNVQQVEFFLIANVATDTNLLLLKVVHQRESDHTSQSSEMFPSESLSFDCFCHDRSDTQEQLHLQSIALNACADVILITNREGIIEWVNPAFTALTGYTPAEAIGHNPRELVNSGHQDRTFFQHLWQTILGGNVWRGEIVNRRKDGSLYVEEMTITPVHDEAGEIAHFIAIKQDVTARKQSEYQQQALTDRINDYAQALKQANGTLQLSEQRYRSVVETQTELICRFQPDGTLTFANEAYARFFDHSQDALVGRNFVDLVPESDRDEVVRQLAELQQLTLDTPVISHEHRATQRNGDLTWQYWINRALFDEHGNLIEIQATGRDITALKQSAEVIRDRERQLDLMFSQSLDGFFFMMLDEPVDWNDTVDKAATLDYVFTHQRITRANQALLEQYGLTEEQFLGMTPADFFAHDLAAGRTVWRQFFDEGRLHIDTQERKADGTPMWIEGDYICLYDDQGRITGHFGVQREVTGLKEAIAALKASESKYRLLIENQTDLVVKIDANGHFLFVSPSYCDLFDKAAEELLGSNSMPLVHEDDRAATEAAMQQLWQPPHTCYLEQRALTRQGWRWLAWSDQAVLDDQGNVVAIVGVGRDITDRKQMERELQQSEQRFRNVLETLTLVAIMLDREGKIIFCNDALLALTGWQHAEVIHQDWFDQFLPPEVHQELHGVFRQTVNRGEFPTYYENEILTRQGDRRTIAWNNTVQVDAKGNVTSITSIGEDVTEQRRYEESIFELSQRLSLATDAAKIGIWDWDIVNDTLIWDEQMHAMYGTTPDTFDNTYAAWQAMVHPDDVHVFQAEATAIAESRRELHHEYRILRPDGEIRYIENRAVLICDRNGRAERMLGANWDISDRKRNEAAIVEASQRLSLATAAAQIGVWDWDVINHRLTWDERVYAIYGLSPEQEPLAYDDWFQCVHPDDQSALADQIAEAVSNPSVSIFRAEFRIIRPDGEIRYIEDHAQLMRNAAGEVLRATGVNLDISDRKQAELALSETHQRLHALMQNSPVLIGLYDETGRYQQVNPITCAFLGLSAAEIVGRRFDEVHSPEVAALFMERIRQVLETNQPTTVEDRLMLRETEHIFRSVLFPVLNEPGSPRLLGMVATEISPLVEAQQRLQRQAERERLTREITENIRRSLNLDVILESTVTGVRQFLKADRVLVYRFNPDWSGDMVVESVSPGWTSVLGETLRDPCFEGKLVEQYRQGHIGQINDVQSEAIAPCHRELLTHYQVRANLVLPLVVNQALWGLLCIHHCQSPRQWQTEEIEFVQQISDQVEIAIQQAKLLEETSIRAQRERLRSIITQHIRCSLDLDVILNTTVREVRQFLKTDRVLLYRFNPDWSGNIIVESVEPGWTEALGSTLRDPCFAGELIQKYRRRQISRLDNIHTAPIAACYRDFLAQFEIQANLVLPLIVEENLWGLLCIHHCRAPRHWEDEEITFIQQICEQVEIAIQQAQFLKQTTARAQRERLFNEIMTAARESLDLQEMMNRTVEKLMAAFQVSRCIISLCSDRDEFLECTAATAVPGMPALKHQRIPLKGNPLAEYVLSHETPVAKADLFTDAFIAAAPAKNVILSIAQRFDIVAVLAIAIRYQGQVRGVLAVHHDAPRSWSADDCLLIQQVADQLAIAIQQAALYQQAQAEIAERMRLEEQLRHDAFHDALTGLPNRTLFLDRLQFALQRFQRWHRQAQRPPTDAQAVSNAPTSIAKDYQFAILFMDLDRFKVINDSLGHSFGDQLLRLVASRLSNCLRDVDMAARLGGDEFVILLEELTDHNFAIEVARRIHNILEVPIFLDDREVFIRASIGIAFGSARYSEPNQILRDADIAMYQAKQSSQEYVVFDTSMHAVALQQMNLENDLRHAIKRKEFQLHYQPVISLSTGKIVSFEALVRWQHPTRGLLYPGAFVEVAEETGLIAAIDLWVLQEACQQLYRWQTQSPEWAELTMGVNLSGKQFSQPDLISQIDHALSSTRLAGKYLKLEITESVLIENDDLAIQTLDAFRARNIQVCMDDFGTGYSSLSYLHRFPVDILKIDKSFILNLSSKTATSRDYEIVKAIINLALNLNLQVVAEGVENRDVLVYLQKNRCPLGQGYYFSPAVDCETATQLLRDQPF